MVQDLLTQGAPRGAIPLTLVTAKSFGAWEKKQNASVRAWIKAQDFKPEGGAFLVLPGGKGVAGVLACLSDPVELWDLAALPRVLAKGVYRLDGKLKAEEEQKLALGWLLGAYRFSRYKKGEETKATLCLSKKIDLKPIRALAAAIMQARDLITTPAEDLGPAELAKAVRETGKKFGAKVSEIVGDDLLKKNYPAIHIVGRASPRAPRLIDLTWGNPKHPKVTLVGKGVCFDTGGLDLKPSSAMYLMRKDMGGAAIALGVARMVMERKLPVRLRLLIPAVENAVDGKSFRPSDILTMRNGITVENGNTDAEGRLVLADALAEAGREKPEVLLSLATLGLAGYTLGYGISSLFSNDEGLAEDLLEAGEKERDPFCRFPLFKEYERGIESRFADVNSSPGGNMGIIPAALFLQRFVPKGQKWALMDFMAWNVSGKPGRPEGGEAMALRAVFTMLEKRFSKS